MDNQQQLRSSSAPREQNNNQPKIWSRNWLLLRGFGHCEITTIEEFIATGSNEEFKALMRMDIISFEFLLSRVENDIRKKVTNMRDPISARSRLIATVRYLATGRSFSDMSLTMRISNSALAKLVIATCKAIIDNLSDFMSLPQTSEEWEATAAEFEQRWHFAHCLGAIDGKHVNIEKPKNSGGMYYNYKGTHSIVLLAVVNANYEFLMASVGTNGRVSDGGVLRNSKFGTALLQDNLNLPPPSRLPGSELAVPYVFIGDEAFGLHKNLMKPYNANVLNAERAVYNNRLSRARAVVEDTFGMLVQKFPVFRQPIRVNPEKASTIVLATCYIHNFLRKTTNRIETLTTSIDDVNNSIIILDEEAQVAESEEAKEIREIFCRIFNE